MKNPILFTTLIIIYIVMMYATHRTCAPSDKKMDVYDEIVIPIISIFWPVAWGLLIANEIVGFFRRKIREHNRKRRQEQKRKQHFNSRER